MTIVFGLANGLQGAAVLATSASVFAGDGHTYIENVPSKSGTSSVIDQLSTTNYVGFASASVQFGVLHATATSAGFNYAPHTYSPTGCDDVTLSCSNDAAFANANFLDTLTITGGTGTGYLVLHLRVDGNISQAGTIGPSGFALSDVSFWGSTSGNPQTFNDLAFQAGSYAGDTLFDTNAPLTYFTQALASNPIQFTFGQPLYIAINMTAENSIDDSQITGTYNFSLSSNFGETATVTGLNVYSDPAAQHAITSASVTSQSGTNYSAVAATPEPASFVMCGSGMVFALGLFLRKRLGLG